MKSVEPLRSRGSRRTALRPSTATSATSAVNALEWTKGPERCSGPFVTSHPARQYPAFCFISGFAASSRLGMFCSSWYAWRGRQTPWPAKSLTPDRRFISGR